ncbi:DJ-1/PfpI family protein [Azospirillum griseum]|uniref:DJ-1/PfpI family protein n=1 Tax=Azospirillum griseum TaxID=2496639 RepID=A0A431VG62_9PROT|nr:DJ-1/PfpI family protein [Azospirillum griseum]RTR19529.1 DJ-1/PfpI family protein [Azospirillum griseum]
MTLGFGLLAFPTVQQLDLSGPYEVFASVPGGEVHLLWKDTAPLRSATGLILTPTTRLEDCPPLDVLCVPGGTGINALLEDAETLAFVRAQADRARFVTSVCTGALVLGAAGLLAGKRATTHWNAMDFLPRFGAIPTPGRVVEDGRIITAGGVTAGIDFGLTVVAALLGRTEAETIQLALEYAPAPPFAAGTPDQAPAPVLAAARDRLAASRAARVAILERWRGA